MDVSDAIKSCFKHYVTFSGRATRFEFWSFQGFVYLLELFVSVIGRVTGHSLWLIVATNLLIFLPYISVFVRRLHDMGKSGWWFWLLFVPFFGLIIVTVWLCRETEVQDNRFGLNPINSYDEVMALQFKNSLELSTAVELCLYKTSHIRGRARRSEYWYFFLFNFIFSIINLFIYILSILCRINPVHPCLILIYMAFSICGFTVSIRRLHDLDKSGWWHLLILLPLIGPIIMLVWNCSRGTVGENRFGPDPLGYE